jgi:RNA recognition motif-containing protein
VYVANLPWAATADEVRSLFGRYGDVHQTAIVTDRRTGRSRGFGFVDMPTPAARAAVDALHGFSLGGRELTVKLAEPKRRRA